MPIYRYKALNEHHQVVRGLVEANTLEAVSELLSERKLTIISLTEQKQGPFSFTVPLINKVRRKSIVVFSRQLAVMITANVPIVQSLRILTTQTDDKALQDITVEMTNDVDGGMKLSSAFAKHPEVFNNFYIAMIRSGETSGRLDKVLNYLASQMEKDFDLISRIRGAMVYPIFILSALVGVGVVMIVFVVPKMTELLVESGAELPFMTKALIAVSGLLQSYWWLLIIVVVSLIVVIRFFTRSNYGRIRWDTAKIHIPIIGGLFTKIILSRFANSLSTLIKGGVPISRALAITAEVVSNSAFKTIIDQTVKEVEDGNSITTVFARSKIIPTMLPQMMSVGEKTGRMDEVLDRVSEFYSREVDTMIGSLTSLIEPMIMIILGIGVGVMVAAVILPMFEIANSIA